MASTSLVQAVPRAGALPRTAEKSVPQRVDRALGNGLGRLVEPSKSGTSSRRTASVFTIDQAALAIRDARGRVLVDVTPRSGVDRASFRRAAEALGLVVRTVDRERGTLEGFVPLAAVPRVAGLAGLGTIAQALKPYSDVGKATSQGVAMQRVNRVQAAGVNGRGITIGALSDSYDAALTDVDGAPLTIHADDDVASGDLPGAGNAAHPTPVVVLEDDVESSSVFDEGRAMLQIAHDVAPAAKLCFATARNGLVGFADNVRRLADKSGRCGADVVVDDVIYLDEPFFSDSALTDAIDDVAGAGTHYFSSAGNAGHQQAWASRVRLLPAATAVRGTNLDFSAVDPALYDGGLQDMRPGRGTDVAQTLTLGEAGGIVDMQWDDPVDIDGATLGDPLFSETGEVTQATPAPRFEFTPAAAQVGRRVQFRVDAVPSGSTDLILSVDAPDGTNLGTVDTGASPEVLTTTLDQAGTYTITVTGFAGSTGDFTLDVSPVLKPSKVTTDFNLLFFAPDGSFLGAAADDNRLSGRPSEIASVLGLPSVQVVIARSGTGPTAPTRLRNVLFGGAFFSEYADPLTPASYGHATARGATAVAAYGPFRPYLPEYFTSPGGDLPIYFDSSGNRFPRTQIRRTPRVAAADGGNTTFFTRDTARDPDSQPNFFGTSAAAPHAAAIAALALQRSGGPGSVRPDAMRQRLQRSGFLHDLDPAHAEGRSHGLTVAANGAQGNENLPVSGSMKSTRFFTLRYTGAVPLRSVTFFGGTASPTALGTRNPPRSDGIVFDPRQGGATVPPRETGFPFAVGGTSGGLSAASVSAAFSRPGGGWPGQFRRMHVRFRDGLARGQAVRFGVDRDLAVSGIGGSNEGNGADEIGGATFFPSGVAVRSGMRFTATRADGATFTGVVRNRLGRGFSPVSGYGLIDAQRAVLGR